MFTKEEERGSRARQRKPSDQNADLVLVKEKRKEGREEGRRASNWMI
jgi:predicted kinase